MCIRDRSSVADAEQMLPPAEPVKPVQPENQPEKPAQPEDGSLLGMMRILTVSYTHLDVYKRQERV